MREEPGKTFLYCQVAERIRDMIRSESLRVGSFLPPERELSRRFGAAFLTVRRALSLLTAEGIIRKIPRQGSVIEKLPTVAGAPRKKRVGITVWLEAGANHPITMERLAMAGEEFPGDKYEIIVIYITREMLERNDWSRLLAIDDLDGLLISVHEIPEAVLDMLGKRPIPTVFLGLAGHAPGGCSDTLGGFALLMDYLTSLGHRDIAFITRSVDNCPGARAQIEAFQANSRRKNLPSAEDVTAAGDYNNDSGYLNTLNRLRSGRLPSAIIYGDDAMAIGGISAMTLLGYDCPKDISVASCAEVCYLASQNRPSITALRVSPENSLARKCLRMLKRMIDAKITISNEYVIVRRELVVRESTALPTQGGPPAR